MDTTIFADGLTFPEGPRWHDGALHCSDFLAHAVYRFDADGTKHTIAEVPGQPSGLGWLPDGTMLVASMTDRRLLRVLDDGTVEGYVSLSECASFHVNDLLVDSFGRAYVGNFGFDLDAFMDTYGIDGLFGDPGPTPTVLVRVDPDRSVRVVAEDMVFPNGMVLLDEGRTLVVAEILAMRLTAFDIADNGDLSNRRVWADLSSQFVAPDGIAVAASGNIWVANAAGPEAVLVGDGGAIHRRVSTSQNCYAVAVGDDGATLFCCTAPTSHAGELAGTTDGKIEFVGLTGS